MKRLETPASPNRSSRPEAGDCDQALQHTDLYGTASEWTHVLRLYLALEAAESKNVAAARRAVMATAQVSLVQARKLCDALLVRIARTLAEKASGTNDAAGWLISFGRSTDAKALLAQYRLAEPLDTAQATPLLTRLDFQVSHLETLTQKGASEAISADPFADPESAGQYTESLQDLFVQLAADFAVRQFIDRALNAMVINPYPRYRNIAFVVLGVAVLAVSDWKWARIRLQKILHTALDREGVTFTFDLPTVLLTEAQRRK